VCKALSRFVDPILVNSRLAHVLLAPSCVSAMISVSNTFPRADSFSIAICS
jgi:hypothetical protein